MRNNKFFVALVPAAAFAAEALSDGQITASELTKLAGLLIAAGLVWLVPNKP